MMTSDESTKLPQTIPYHVAEQIRRGIIRGRYAPGMSLRELDLRADFGSSRGPLREGLRLLELQGLVVHSPRRGFRVRAHTRDELRSIYELRALLEARAIEALAQSNVGPLIAELKASNKRMKEHIKAKMLDEYFDENIRFHQRITDYTGDRPLIHIISNLNEMALPIRYLLIAETFPKGMSRYDYHDKIVSLIATRKFSAAKRLTKEHVMSNLKHAIDAYTRLAHKAEEEVTAA